MKKLIFIMALSVAAFTCSAQIAKVALRPADKGTAPQVVLDSIKKAFPEPISQTLTSITAAHYGKQWNVEISPASEQEQPYYYQVAIKNEDGRYLAIYDKNGNLLKVRQVLKNTPLPEEVSRTLSTKYQGWSVLDKEERISSGKKFSNDYKVLLKKGILKKAVYFDEGGNIKRVLPAV
ncbi:hypothetical protein [Daejeonella lutea]|uniref:Uncharacterized protein n=1 Tax=Daejeonella lutea TaxID=572036 RepID=A0A1T5CVY1_9SPHI|nr:hypothetical protein [Daejeonella lutea]SKB63688.1 hypothetical protein SAMN05661099_1950 [Daejeonella lutea]